VRRLNHNRRLPREIWPRFSSNTQIRVRRCGWEPERPDHPATGHACRRAAGARRSGAVPMSPCVKAVGFSQIGSAAERNSNPGGRSKNISWCRRGGPLVGITGNDFSRFTEDHIEGARDPGHRGVACARTVLEQAGCPEEMPPPTGHERRGRR